MNVEHQNKRKEMWMAAWSSVPFNSQSNATTIADTALKEFDKRFKENPDEVETISQELNEKLNLPIDCLEFTTRTFGYLNYAKIKLVSDLVNCTRKDILQIRNIGHLSLSEIEQTLELMGLSLKELPIVKELSTMKKIVGIDFITDEFQDIKNKAKERGLSISEYINMLKINK
jgi:DNA-directed RNA polymerase alpha subunit